MTAREAVGFIADRIEDLDFGYESENSFEDTWNAALDIAIYLRAITPQQRTRIEIEDKNQRRLERYVDRIETRRRWDLLSPEQQELRRSIEEGYRAQSKLMRDMFFYNISSIAFKTPPFDSDS